VTQRIDKPWGYEIIWAHTPFYVGKILHINAGAKLSRQFHLKKTETFMVKSGEMNLETSDDDLEVIINMKPGDVFHCPPNTIHRMCAVTDTEVIEVSTPELDDVVRIEDDYGR
jgi:mannose-6-phosphate isomerase